MRRPALLLAAAALALAAPAVAQAKGLGPAITGAARSGDSLWLARIDGTLQRIDAQRLRSDGRMQVGRLLQSLDAGFGSLWAVDSGVDLAANERGVVLRIDPSSGQVRARIALPKGHPCALAAGAGAVWVAPCRSRTVYRIDPDRGRLTAGVRPGAHRVTALAATDGALWALVAGGRDPRREPETVRRIDARTGRVGGRPIPLRGVRNRLVAARGSVWAVGSAGAVTRIDTHALRAGRPRETRMLPWSSAAGGGAVWIAGAALGVRASGIRVARLDREGRRLTRHTIGGLDFPTALVAGPSQVWVAGDAGRQQAVVRLDAASGRVTGRLGLALD